MLAIPLVRIGADAIALLPRWAWFGDLRSHTKILGFVNEHDFSLSEVKYHTNGMSEHVLCEPVFVYTVVLPRVPSWLRRQWSAQRRRRTMARAGTLPPPLDATDRREPRCRSP